jgi:transcriptional regulator with XRE-family HTH domain
MSDVFDRVAYTMRAARAQARVPLRELAIRVGTSHATLSAYEKGRKIPSVATFLRVVEACNYEVEFKLTPRIRHADGIARGDELVQVLVLAEQFPSHLSATLDLPLFPNK